MPSVSVFTPTHDPRWLGQAYASLAAQTHSEWEWIVLLNGAAAGELAALQAKHTDPRVVIRCNTDVAGVGAAKAAAVELCDGELLVELDHDDVLSTTALERLVEAYVDDPTAGLYYSHCAQLSEAGKPQAVRYNDGLGWEYREARVDGVRLEHAVTPAVTPHNLAYIWWAPNHVRAFSRAAYDAAGGYDPARPLLDDQDLMCRLYELADFHLVDEVLYGQRNHDAQTQLGPAESPAIQAGTTALYDEYFERLALAWAHRAGWDCLDLGGAHGDSDGRYLRVDMVPAAGVDLVHEFPARFEALPDSSVGVIRAYDFLEHVADKVALINELHRLLVPGGVLLTRTPSTDGRGAWQDPTHVAGYNEASFQYYTDPAMAGYVPELTARFQLSRLVTYPQTPLAVLAAALEAGTPPAAAAAVAAGYEATWLPYVQANLIAIKPGADHPRNAGVLLWT